MKNCTTSSKNRLCYEQVLTRKNAPARRFGDSMAACSRKGSGMGTPIYVGGNYMVALGQDRRKIPPKMV